MKLQWMNQNVYSIYFFMIMITMMMKQNTWIVVAKGGHPAVDAAYTTGRRDVVVMRDAG